MLNEFDYFIGTICRNTLKAFKSVSVRKSNLKFRTVASTKGSQ